MIEATTREEVAELRAENPEEHIMLKDPRSPHWLLFRPGERTPVPVPARGRKARYTDGKPRPY